MFFVETLISTFFVTDFVRVAMKANSFSQNLLSRKWNICQRKPETPSVSIYGSSCLLHHSRKFSQIRQDPTPLEKTLGPNNRNVNKESEEKCETNCALSPHLGIFFYFMSEKDFDPI